MTLLFMVIVAGGAHSANERAAATVDLIHRIGLVKVHSIL